MQIRNILYSKDVASSEAGPNQFIKKSVDTFDTVVSHRVCKIQI